MTAIKFAMDRNKVLKSYELKHNGLGEDAINEFVTTLEECNHVSYIGLSEWIQSETYELLLAALAKNKPGKGKKGKKKK